MELINMGERTLLTLTDGTDKIRLYLHWYNVEDCKKAVKETEKKVKFNTLTGVEKNENN